METPKDFLSEEDKQFIITNYEKMSVLQMAMRLNVVTENRKCPLIADFIRLSNLQKKSDTTTDKPVEVVASVPAATVEEKTGKIISQGIKTDVPLEDEPLAELASVEAFAAQLREYHIKVHEPLSEREIGEIKFLIHQMQSTRFLQIVQTFRKKEYKNLFREEFIRSMYGKGEMPQEEVNDFIDMCEALVYQHDCRCKIKDLERMLEDKELPKEKRVGIMQLQKELHNEVSSTSERISTIKKGLGTLREQRMKDTRNTGMTLAGLFEAFYENEKKQTMMVAREKYSTDLKEALKKIDMLAETKALIMGISKDELMNGGL